MSWFCNTKEAREHKENCTKNSWECGECIWIDESSNAMASAHEEMEIREAKKNQPIKPKLEYNHKIGRWVDVANNKLMEGSYNG